MKIKSKSLRKKSVAVLAGLAIAGTVGASAASLGGLNSDNLGADTGVVASCDDNGIAVAYTTAWDATAVDPGGVTNVTVGSYVVDGITLTGVAAACDGQTWDAEALDSAGASIGTGNGTLSVDASGEAILTIATPFLAEDLEGLALSISG